MKLDWKPLAGGLPGDCYADTPREDIAYGRGRWTAKRRPGKNVVTVLRFNGDVVGRFEGVVKAKKEAETRTGAALAKPTRTLPHAARRTP